MTDEEIIQRIRELPKHGTGLLVPGAMYEALKRRFLENYTRANFTAPIEDTYLGLRITENPFLPPDTICFIDNAGKILAVHKIELT